MIVPTITSPRRAALLVSSLVLLLAGCGGPSKSTAVKEGLNNYLELARTSRPTGDQQSSGSLWTESAGYRDAFRDVKAKQVADIVTIRVLESTNAVAQATTASTKKSSMGTSVANLGGLENSVPELPSLLSTSSDRQFAGDASTARRNELTTNIAAKVTEVFPNGYLLLEGSRAITVNNEQQLVQVKGVVRPSDIAPDNTVYSSRLAELEVSVEGKGVVSNAQKPGILFKILSGILPF